MYTQWQGQTLQLCPPCGDRTTPKGDGLYTLAAEYLEAAAKLRLGLEKAQRQRESAPPPEQKRWDEKLRLLRQMLGEMRDLRQLTQAYYTGSRDGRYTTATLKAPRRRADR